MASKLKPDIVYSNGPWKRVTERKERELHFSVRDAPNHFHWRDNATNRDGFDLR
jgi:hypothetical protein